MSWQISWNWSVNLACAIAAGMILYSRHVPAEGPFPADDATISAAVKARLWNEESLAHTDIRVETDEGAVTLRGFASTMEDIATAGRLARAVRGVRGVTNAIRVAVKPSRT